MIRKFENKDGTVRYQASVKIAGHRLYHKSDSHQGAVEWVNEMRFKRDRKVPCFKRVTIDDLFFNYIENAKNKDNSPATMMKVNQAFQNHIKPFYADNDLTSVTIEEHKAFIKYLREKRLNDRTLQKTPTENKLSSASINRIRSLMSTMYNTAMRQGTFGEAFASNPFEAISPMRGMNQRLVYWDMKSIQTFLDSERDSQYYPLWVLMLNTGLRMGEAVAAHADQFDLFADIMTVDRQFCMATNRILLQTKSCRIREIGLNDKVKEIVYPTIGSGPLFTSPSGTRLTSYYLTKKVFPEACAKAGVKNIGLHGLRHTFASHYMMEGGSLYDLQKILGHSNMKTTERYAHFSRLHLKQKSNVVGFDGNIIKVDFERKQAVNE